MGATWNRYTCKSKVREINPIFTSIVGINGNIIWISDISNKLNTKHNKCVLKP